MTRHPRYTPLRRFYAVIGFTIVFLALPTIIILATFAVSRLGVLTYDREAFQTAYEASNPLFYAQTAPAPSLITIINVPVL